ncbi:response regulator [Chitiniphilus eburneus]|uniref:Response regulator n=1 Tax=Chitiniphilus eburneus TaxID=2571148 RepID=A0A4U0PWS2_9NEIS|nr:response regulator [Chitiniphilus eburneus]TJZ72032.1 response regulator [Chitiniphilus eburneus]
MPVLNILYVEDNAMLRVTIAEYLSDLGHLPVAVGSAEDALTELHRHRFDVLLSDVSLPGRSGIELVRDAARLQPELVLVLSSGHDLSADAELLGVPVELLPKPFDIDALEDVLDRAAVR